MRIPWSRTNGFNLEKIILIGWCGFVLLMTFSFAIRAEYGHDEDQFIASARLLLDKGLLPYRDYPFFHTPYLVFIYAILFRFTADMNLLAARTFSALCAAITIVLVGWFAWINLERQSLKWRLGIGMAVMLLFLSSPLFANAASFSWNHALPGLLFVLAFFTCFFSVGKSAFIRWIFVTGAFIGVAIGVRASAITMVPAFLICLAVHPGEDEKQTLLSWKRAFTAWLAFTGGLILALLPLLIFLVSVPKQFLFGNLEYAGLNTAYRQETPIFFSGNQEVFGAVTFAEKLAYFGQNVIDQPANLLVAVGLIYWAWTGLGTALVRKETHVFIAVLALIAAPFAFLGSLLPTPVWYQYFYAPLPFIILAVVLGLIYSLQQSQRNSRWLGVFFIELAILAALTRGLEYRRITYLTHPNLWKPVEVHRIGLELKELLGSGARVFSLAPIYPLEGGLSIYPEFATGTFAFRTASLLSSNQRKTFGMVSLEELPAFLDAQPPAGILTGFDDPLEEPIVAYALNRGYQMQRIDSRLILWSQP